MSVFKVKNTTQKILVSLAVLILFSVSGYIANAIIIDNGPFAPTFGSTDATIIWTTNGDIASPAASDSTVYYTASNGPEWIAQNNPSGQTIYDIDFATNDDGWGVGRSGLIIHTVNGGDEWVEQSGVVSNSITRVRAIDANSAWALSPRELIKTTNSGDSWSIIKSTTSIIYEDLYIEGNDIYIVTYDGTLIHSDDNGNNWISTNISSDPLNSIEGIRDTIWCVGNQGTIYYSPDRGNTWESQNSVNSYNLRENVVLDENNAWAVGVLGLIIHTSDGGQNWHQQNSNTTLSLHGLDISPSHSLYATGYQGVTLYSDNSGASWDVIEDPISGVFNSVEVVRDDRVFFGGTDLYFYGLDYNSVLYDSDLVVTHIMNLTGLSHSTTYYYYVCSENTEGNEVCSSKKYFITLGACSDGTLADECNGDQYCDPALLILVDNCTQCSYICPASTVYCDTSSGQCEEGCDTTTAIGECNGTQYCESANNFVNNCMQCSYICPASTVYCDTSSGQCEEGCDTTTAIGECNGTQYCESANNFVSDCRYCSYSCPTDNIFCNNGICQPGCDANTAIGECNGTQYCESANNFVNDCTQCNYICPASTIYCDTTSGDCQPGCDANTAVGECSGSQYCESANNFVNDCTQCNYICPNETPFCNNGTCEAWCTENVSPGDCSGDFLCNDDLDLVHFCSFCGYNCPSEAPYCDESSGNCLSDRCADGSFPNQCSSFTIGQYCQSDLTLVDNCNCGYPCPANSPYCDNNGTCQSWCEDETPGGTCNLTTFEYCDNAENAFIIRDDCGTKMDQCEYVCPSEFPYCNRTTGECVEACLDGTLEGECSGDFYCNSSLELVNDCRQTSCGYTCLDPTPQCNEETGVCEIDNEGPVISSINIDVDVFSAILTFETNEPAWSTVMVETNPYCSPESSVDNVVTIYNGDLLINHLIDIIELDSSATYYLCIYVTDDYGNVTFSGEPSEIFFETSAEPDTTAPEVNIITPNEGDTVSATQTIEVEATDNVEISYLEIFMDSSTEAIAHLVSPSSGNIYSSAFDSTLWDNGEHTLHASARDTSGNIGQSAAVTFIINNDVGPPVIDDISAEISVESDLHMATITWTTNEPATSRIDYTLENIEDGDYDTSYGGDTACADLGHCVQSTEYTTEHTIILNNLASNRRYHYQVTSCDPQGNCSH